MMGEEKLAEYLRPLDNPDNASRFEIDVRKHLAGVGIVEGAYALLELFEKHGLKASVVWDVEEAVADGDHEELLEACCRLLEALPSEAEGQEEI
jgi:hypothetical protein